MRVGTICYATNSGLGLLAKSFYDHGVVTDAMLVRHPHYVNHEDWYPIEDRFWPKQVGEFLSRIDFLLLFEQAVGNTWSVVAEASRRNIPVVMMPMYEWTPRPLPVPADLFLCPSKLDQQYYQTENYQLVAVPVDVSWRRRERALRFVHNAGHCGTKFRNGTLSLIEAIQHIQSPINLTIRCQPDDGKCRQLFASLCLSTV